MKKNNIKFYLLIAILFAINAKSVLADDLTPIDPVASTTEEIATTTEDISTTTTEISSNTVTVNLNVRYQDSMIFSGPVTLIKNATTTITDNTNTSREIKNDTALAALNQADINSVNFNISNLAYYASWNSFLINCLDVAPSTNSPLINACYNWQYVVNDTYPYVGADQYNLSNGDNIYFYFGTPRIVELSTSTIGVGDSIMATAKSYDYKNNLYIPVPNYTIGITQPDPNNPWSPNVIMATTSNNLGQGIFIINQSGSYGVGIAEDYYSILINLLVVATNTNSVATTTSTTTTATSTNSTNAGNSQNNYSVDINKAITFLIANQSADGSFSNVLYTDWAAIGLAASGNSSAKSLIKNYLLNQKFSADNLTDNERHAMALMSLEINPYTGTNTNYISKILDEFDGTQFGDKGLINDDIFALFPLLNAGYNSSDPEISKTVAYIISKQNYNGSFDSVDLTAAAIQALSLVTNLPNVNSALEKAKTYLKNSQQSDGGFGNIFSTVWVKQVLNSNTSDNYLASKQKEDGGLETGSDLNSRIWATAYLIPAYYGKSWNSIMSNFGKLKTEIISKNNSDNLKVNPEEIAKPEVTENTEALIETLTAPVLNNFVDKTVLDLENLAPKDSNSKDVGTNNINNRIKNPDNLNLQANVLGSFENLPIIKTFNSIFNTTLAGLGVMWGFIASLFKI